MSNQFLICGIIKLYASGVNQLRLILTDAVCPKNRVVNQFEAKHLLLSVKFLRVSVPRTQEDAISIGGSDVNALILLV